MARRKPRCGLPARDLRAAYPRARRVRADSADVEVPTTQDEVTTSAVRAVVYLGTPEGTPRAPKGVPLLPFAPSLSNLTTDFSY